MSSIRIAIVGSRDFEDYELLHEKLVEYLFDVDYEGGADGEWERVLYGRYDKVTIVSGGAKGADALAERFADSYYLDKNIYYPNWDLYGKSAGFVRNAKIVDNCDVLFAFQINNSKGTQHSINLAKEKNKEVFVYNIERENNV